MHKGFAHGSVLPHIRQLVAHDVQLWLTLCTYYVTLNAEKLEFDLNAVNVLAFFLLS